MLSLLYLSCFLKLPKDSKTCQMCLHSKAKIKFLCSALWSQHHFREVNNNIYSEIKLPTSSRSRTGHSHRCFSLLSWGAFNGARDPGFAALLWGDDECGGASGGGGGLVCDICIVDVAVVLSGETIVCLPAVALVLPLLCGQDAARLLHRVVVGLLDLRLHIIEVLRAIVRRLSETSLLMSKMMFSFIKHKHLPVAERWSWSCLPRPPPLCCSHPPWTPGLLTSAWR